MNFPGAGVGLMNDFLMVCLDKVKCHDLMYRNPENVLTLLKNLENFVPLKHRSL